MLTVTKEKYNIWSGTKEKSVAGAQLGYQHPHMNVWDTGFSLWQDSTALKEQMWG